MELLNLLEKKILDLVELVKKQKQEILTLSEENTKLKEKIDNLETALLSEQSDLDEEKELTKLVVDGLIKDIDSLVSSEQR